MEWSVLATNWSLSRVSLLVIAATFTRRNDLREIHRPNPLPNRIVTIGVDGELAWRQHDGGHEDRTNMRHFLTWANRLLGR